MVKYNEILRLHQQGLSLRAIASSTRHSRQMVTSVIERAKVGDFSLDADKTDAELHRLLFPEKTPENKGRMVPDFETVHAELAKSGVTLSLLWEEYRIRCASENKLPYSYRQFCRDYSSYAEKTKATLRIKRKPGEIMEVDWAGQAAYLVNELTGELIPAPVFVATLPCSQYTYVEALPNMDSSSWIAANTNALEYFGGVPVMVVCDNLKTGVDRSCKYAPVINKVYDEWAEHYGTAIVPGRVRSPKDKASVEGNVGHISTWILARLRNRKFFSLDELNAAITECLEEVNAKPFQKLEGSRRTAFLEEEKFALRHLPVKRYEISHWKTVKVGDAYHVEVDKMLYSVPYEYIKHEVDVRMTAEFVEIFYKGLRIASHRRIKGRLGQIHTEQSHMPPNHLNYMKHSPEYVAEWAKGIGVSTEKVVAHIFESYPTLTQATKIGAGLMKLAQKHSEKELEEACAKALSHSGTPDLRSIQLLISLKALDKRHPDLGQTKYDTKDFENTREPKGHRRGAGYYGGKV